MENWITETKTYTYLQSIKCDCCGIEYSDNFEQQEFLRWKNNCGYASEFGDGKRISLDLCQYCVKNILYEYIQCQ